MQTCYVVDYGEGVYFFPYEHQNFGNALASFLRQNPSLQVSSIAPSSSDSYGYFVICRMKTVSESDSGPFPYLPTCEMSSYPTSQGNGSPPILPSERPAPPIAKPVVPTPVDESVISAPVSQVVIPSKTIEE
ncbi:TPA: hypothetical protein DEP34_02620 [Candidatus Uhrbacteria bacterium]|nr:hypothetical protein [Candidatus Uhrbacteria bacterium]HCB19255.1 hypothetical protein [Candidatus Uhrbacteria bacterium]